MTLLASIMPTYDVPRASQESVLRLECWYHGMLTRLRAECLVCSQGDFLVRDSISFKGDFVLTAFWNGNALHFQINKDRSVNSSSGFVFQFEEEQFESVSDLITFYQTHQKPITRNSGCVIKNPVPNTTVIANKILEPNFEIEQNYVKILRPHLSRNNQDRSLSQKVMLNEARKQLNLKSTFEPILPDSSIPSSELSHLSLSDLLSRPLPKPIQSPDSEDQEEYSEVDYDAMDENMKLPISRIPLESPLVTPNEDEVLDASSSSLNHLPTHKSSLISLNSLRDDVSSQTSKRLNTTKLSQVTSASCHDISRLHWCIPRSGSVPALPKRKFSLPIRDSGCVADNADYDQPKVLNCTKASTSAIDLINHRSALIEPNNKPQSQELLQKQLLLSKKAEKCAKLITLEDCRLLRLEKNFKNLTKCEQLNGLSLILLPNGQTVRNDLLERSLSLHYLCILSILHQAYNTERYALYSAWLEISKSLLLQYGNAFSFVTLIDALCSDHVIFIANDKTLCQMRKNLQLIAAKVLNCEPLPNNCPKINIPFMQVLIKILSAKQSTDYCLDVIKSTTENVADNLWKWLIEGRIWIKRATELNKFYINLCNDEVSDDENFLSIEFSLKLLFGYKGYTVNAQKRYEKLTDMANILKERCKLTA
ncbi:unnamed protein product [Thelazia callipaeda]|uniref:SH2 domain-containing protein n=1 Tax=Thelazia callipaeda TaxID=103827 RepID=A0A0N5CL63_THECL|nr:unnamed protein product [Thelazia callipaeda]